MMSRERNDEHDEIREQQQKTDIGTGHGVRGQGGQEESQGVPVDGDASDASSGNG
jgi:hypothetical protein